MVQPDVDGAGLLAARLRGAGLRVAVTPRDWAAAAGGVDVVIGARAAVWSPCPGLAGIVVIDEHDESLQDERSPTWHARDVAVERARRAAVPCWLVSPTPTLEALAWAGSRASRPSRVEERNGWPFVAVVDRSVEELPLASPVSRALLEACRDPHQRVVCVLNTKGRSRRLVCRACRAQVTCAACHAGVSQARDATLHCSRCEATRPALCNACGSTRLAGIGIGIARLRDDVAKNATPLTSNSVVGLVSRVLNWGVDEGLLADWKAHRQGVEELAQKSIAVPLTIKALAQVQLQLAHGQARSIQGQR